MSFIGFVTGENKAQELNKRVQRNITALESKKPDATGSSRSDTESLSRMKIVSLVDHAIEPKVSDQKDIPFKSLENFEPPPNSQQLASGSLRHAPKIEGRAAPLEGKIEHPASDLNSTTKVTQHIVGSMRDISLPGINHSLAEAGLLSECNNAEDTDERETIIDWLSSTNYTAQHNDHLARRHEGTVQWILDTSEFQNWQKNEDQILFCQGTPGAGKTILTSFVIDQLIAKSSVSSVGVAYFYLNFQHKGEQSALRLLSSLLKQLVQKRHPLPQSVKLLCHQHKDRLSRPSLREISRTIHAVASGYSRTFVVVDALDECRPADLMKFLKHILRMRSTNLFATSRSMIPDFLSRLTNTQSLEIRADERDVKSYLDYRMIELATPVKTDKEVQSEIKAKIVQSAQGSYVLLSTILRYETDILIAFD
jgi:Cdc6-like AAA superfamily ATPase